MPNDLIEFYDNLEEEHGEDAWNKFKRIVDKSENPVSFPRGEENIFNRLGIDSVEKLEEIRNNEFEDLLDEIGEKLDNTDIAEGERVTIMAPKGELEITEEGKIAKGMGLYDLTTDNPDVKDKKVSIRTPKGKLGVTEEGRIAEDMGLYDLIRDNPDLREERRTKMRNEIFKHYVGRRMKLEGE